MKYVAGCLTTIMLCLFSISSFAAEVNCECPKLGCDPCSTQTNITFYSEKCGPDNSKVRSCARPTCIPVEETSKECPVLPVANSGPREPIVVKTEVPKESGIEPVTVASVGKVKVIQGSVSILRADGKKILVASDTDLNEGDTIASEKDGKAIVAFNGGNKLHVHEDTQIEVKEAKDQQLEASRRTLLHLIKGKVRNQVEQKYNGKTSYYHITTTSAVAGVRGTDFIMEHSDDPAIGTKLETLKGRVIFGTPDQKETREINRGEGAKFASGKLGQVYKMSDEQMKALDMASRVDLAKRHTPKESAICSKPKGMFNQCLWKCMNNPAGEKKCRVDITNVSCVRQRCNGNGDWAEETRVSEPSAPMACPGTGVLVKDCDY